MRATGWQPDLLTGRIRDSWAEVRVGWRLVVAPGWGAAPCPLRRGGGGGGANGATFFFSNTHWS